MVKEDHVALCLTRGHSPEQKVAEVALVDVPVEKLPPKPDDHVRVKGVPGGTGKAEGQPAYATTASLGHAVLLRQPHGERVGLHGSDIVGQRDKVLAEYLEQGGVARATPIDNADNAPGATVRFRDSKSAQWP